MKRYAVYQNGSVINETDNKQQAYAYYYDMCAKNTGDLLELADRRMGGCLEIRYPQTGKEA